MKNAKYDNLTQCIIHVILVRNALHKYMDPLNIPMANILPGRPATVKSLAEDHNVLTLRDALNKGLHQLHKYRGLGRVSVEEIEIALLRRGYSLYSHDKKVIAFVNGLVTRYSMTNKSYRVGYPMTSRGELRIEVAHQIASIVIREGGTITL